jgi:hypothetical protein
MRKPRSKPLVHKNEDGEPELRVGLIKKYEGILKVTAGVVASVGVLYTAAWGIGVAPITNAKTAEMVEEHIKTHRLEIVQNFKDDFKAQNEKIKELDTAVRGIADQNVRTDERTKAIIEEQKQQRDIQNRILQGIDKIQQK